MGETVPVALLQPGNWIAAINGTDLGADLKVEQISRGFLTSEGTGEWGLVLSDGVSRFLRGRVQDVTAYRANADESVMLDLQEAGQRYSGERRTRVIEVEL
jgi:hypothetical protein